MTGGELADLAKREHVTILGRRGTGKSFALHRLTEALPVTRHRVILDCKGDVDRRGNPPNLTPWPYRRQRVVESIPDLMRALRWPRWDEAKPTLIVRPPGAWLKLDPATWGLVVDSVWAWAQEGAGKHLRGKDKWPGLTLCMDEYMWVATASTWPRGLQGIYQQGRALDINALAASLRPSRVPAFSMSEAGAVLLFHLNRKEDRKIVYDATDWPEALIDPAVEAEHKWGLAPKAAWHTAWLLTDRAASLVRMH